MLTVILGRKCVPSSYRNFVGAVDASVDSPIGSCSTGFVRAVEGGMCDLMNNFGILVGRHDRYSTFVWFSRDRIALLCYAR